MRGCWGGFAGRSWRDGYAWSPCLTQGCSICGAPPFTAPEHYSGSVVALALMSGEDRARAVAHQQAFPLLRRPNDPPTIPDDRFALVPTKPEESAATADDIEAALSANRPAGLPEPPSGVSSFGRRPTCSRA